MTFKRLYIVAGLTIFPISLPAIAQQDMPLFQQGQSQVENTKLPDLNPNWVLVATKQLSTMMNRGGNNLASSVQQITHPTGSNAALANYNILNLGDRMMIQMTVIWSGASGTTYQTSVNWELTPEKHLSAAVVGDSALVEISPQNKLELNNYFQQRVYPFFFSDMKNYEILWH